MKERREKENKVIRAQVHAPSSLSTSIPMDASDVFSTAGTSTSAQLMISPPPEDELRTLTSPSRRPVHEPLSFSSRSNQSQSDKESQNQLLKSPGKAASKRKRTITNNAMSLGSPQRVTTSSTSGSVQTPNPRSRKQGRHAETGSPTSSPRKVGQSVADGPEILLQSPTRRGGTPSSKPNSKSRTQPLELLSPHAKNPLADFIPASLLTISPRAGRSGFARRRSVTPIPPYEPPPERFTPPREIIASPISAGVTKKKERKKRSSQLHMPHRVKQEPPDIDLTAPLPPPSPGDDPILLVGPPTPERLRRRRSSGLSKEASLIDFEMDLNLPEGSDRNIMNANPGSQIAVPSPRRAVAPVFDFSGIDNEDSGYADDGDVDVVDGDLYASVPTFDGGDIDDDSSDDDLEGPSMGEGDFTGRFLEFHKRTKDGPPKDRVERPVSPHPKRLSMEGIQLDLDELKELNTEPIQDAEARADSMSEKEEESEPDLSQLSDSVKDSHPTEDSLDGSDAEDADNRPAFEDKQGRRLTLSEVEAIKFGPRELSPGIQQNEGDSYDTSGMEDPSTQHDNSASYDGSQSHNTTLESTEDSMDMDANSNIILNNEILNTRALAQEDSQASCISVSETAVDSQEQDAVEEAAGSDIDEDTSSDEAISDTSVVKIMSDDPMAAARAAAILKMYDYDMIAKKLKRKRRATSGNISKRYSSPKVQQMWRRRTVAGLSGEKDLLGNISLPELLEKAEHDLLTSPARSRIGSIANSEVGSPSRASSTGLGFLYQTSDLPGPRDWAKADWKLLDSCFTDERYDLADEQGLELGSLAPVDDLNLDNVIDRFVEHMGGIEIVESHGPSWSKEKLLNRVRALGKRQREGNGAPPTPDVSSRFSTPSRFLSPTPSMVVPDFTPMGLGRISYAGSSNSHVRKASLPPPSSEPFFRSASLQPSMPSKQSRLRREVSDSGPETPPRPSVALFGFETPSRREDDDDSDDESVALEVENLLTPKSAALWKSQPEPGSAVKRSLNYISSWMKPGMFASKENKSNGQRLPGLPAPPLIDRPRGPIETPAPKPGEKIVPPKDQVSLQQAPPPRPQLAPDRKPRRLVELNHVPTPDGKHDEIPKQKKLSRRSSVKDLVRGFEAMDSQVRAVPPRVAELRKMASIESMKAKGKKPAWKP